MATSSTPLLVDPEKQQGYLDLAESLQNPTESKGETMAGWIPITVALLSLAGQVGSWFVNRNSQREQNAFQEGLIDKQNAYNSPSAQLNRLLAAGVPYNTAMSMMGGTVGAATQPMSGQAAPYTALQPPSMGDVASMVAAGDQHDIAQSQVRLNDAQAYHLDPGNPMNEARRILDLNQAILAGKQTELAEAQRVQAEEQTVLIQKQQMTEFYKSEKEFQDVNSYHRRLNANLKLMAAETGKSEAECWGILQKTALELRMEGVQRELFSSQSSSYRASARLSNAEAAVKEVKDGDIPAMARSILLQNLFQSQQNDIEYFWNRPIMTWSKSECKNFGSWSAAVLQMSTSEAMRNKRFAPGIPEPVIMKHKFTDDKGKRWYF